MIRSVLTLVLVSICAVSFSSAQTFKAAFVNSETIIKELPEAQAASKKIEDMGSRVRDTLQIMQKDFESKFEQYRKQEALLSAEAKRKEEETLNNLRMRYSQYQEEKTAELGKVRESYLAPIRQKVTEAIAAVAKEDKINMVLDKAAGLVLFAEDKSDITYKVLDRMKRGEK
ncbi:MAG: OmpH family outer membrane protein [Ignavibacteria bacterium]|nr:OmpH family outer membrane protein [Ignavibacteria bacterium]